MQSSRIRRTIRNRSKLTNGQHDMGNWRLCKTDNSYEVWHINHCMLQWKDNSKGRPYDWSIWKSTGIGSVTDQQIVNAILDELGVNLYFSRKGDSHYVTLDH